MNPRFSVYVAAIATLTPAASIAQASRDSIARVRAAAIDSTRKLFLAQYVDADTARMIAGRLEQHLRAKDYADWTDSGFASALTTDLRSVNGDAHLRFIAGRPAAAPLGGNPGAQPFLGRVEVLEGGIGLLELRRIAVPTPDAIAELREAFGRLADVSALIIDVRAAPGGAAAMVDTLWSYFVADSMATMTAWTRATNQTVHRFVVPRRDAPRFSAVPLFILTSGGTASAAEGFAFFLQQSGRAKVVGSRSVGAGHYVQLFPLAGGYAVTISTSRVRSATTGKEFERVGVVPDVATPPAQALDKALELARAASKR